MDAPRVISFAFPGIPNVRCAFQTRQGGASAGVFSQGNVVFRNGDDAGAVLANRRALRETLGFEHWTEVWQVHGVIMRFDPEPTGVEGDGILEGDGLATARPGQALVVKTADCQPLLLAHQAGGHVAALHVGWRGNEQNFPAKGVAAFCQHYDLDPSELMAVRGPSLGPAASEFTRFEEEWGAGFSPWFDPATRTMDLWRLTRDQLVEAGLRPNRVFSLDLCTRSLPDSFYSYRRGREPGRQASFIWIENAENDSPQRSE